MGLTTIQDKTARFKEEVVACTNFEAEMAIEFIAVILGTVLAKLEIKVKLLDWKLAIKDTIIHFMDFIKSKTKNTSFIVAAATTVTRVIAIFIIAIRIMVIMAAIAIAIATII